MRIGFAPRLVKDGAELYEAAITVSLPGLIDALAELPTDQPGLRLRGIGGLVPFLAADGALGCLVSQHLGVRSRPVRAILFDKSERTNWALGWHQDRTICVERRVPVTGYETWSLKQGMQHVEPPFSLLERMLTMRVHLDNVSEQNAPLLIAPGSHKLGRLRESEIADAVQRCGTFACTARAGDVWLYATPILHASPIAVEPSRRRVLQIDFSADDLPCGLAWRGV
jgi:hypothetical protein